MNFSQCGTVSMARNFDRYEHVFGEDEDVFVSKIMIAIERNTIFVEIIEQSVHERTRTPVRSYLAFKSFVSYWRYFIKFFDEIFSTECRRTAVITKKTLGNNEKMKSYIKSNRS